MRSAEHSRDSCIISVTASIFSIFFLFSFFCIPAERNTMRSATGIGQTIASPNMGDHATIITPTAVVNISEAMRAGIQWESAVSCIVTSPIMRTVRSVGSFLAKNDSGTFLIFSAMPVRTFLLSW